MAKHKIVYGLGSRIRDNDVYFPENKEQAASLWEDFATSMDGVINEINAEIDNAHESLSDSEKEKLHVVSIITGKDHQDQFFPYIEKWVDAHKDVLRIDDHIGGSVPNSFAAAVCNLTEEERANTDFYHTVTTEATTYNIVNPFTGRKTMATFRPENPGMQLSDKDKEMAGHKDIAVVMFPKSSADAFVDLCDQVVKLAKKANPDVVVIPTQHGNKPPKNPEFMISVTDATSGDHDEMGFLDRFKKQLGAALGKGALIVVTNGAKGLTMYSKLLSGGKKDFAALSVDESERDPDASNIGAGNIIEGLMIDFFLRHGKKGYTADDLKDLGLRLNAGGGVGIMFAGSTLTGAEDGKWLKKIDERYQQLKSAVNDVGMKAEGIVSDIGADIKGILRRVKKITVSEPLPLPIAVAKALLATAEVRNADGATLVAPNGSDRKSSVNPEPVQNFFPKPRSELTFDSRKTLNWPQNKR